MELPFLSFTSIFTFLLFLFMVVKILLPRAKAKNNTSSKIPPGPWRLPLIGNLHQLASSALPHHRLRDLANKHGPLMHLQLGEISTIVVTSPEIAQEVLRTHDINFSHRPSFLSLKILSYEYTNIVAAPYGNYWRQLRKICTVELLSAKRVQSFRSIREEEVFNLVNAIQHSSEEGSLVNLSEKIFALTYCTTARAALGNKCKDQEAFKSIVVEFIKMTSGFCIADLYPSIEMLQVVTGMKQKLDKLHFDRDKILEDILNEHKERRNSSQGESEEDLVDVFLKLQQDNDLEYTLTDDNIKAVLWDIFSAGSETSSTALEWAMAEMLKNPRVMKEAQAEVRRVFDGKGNVNETNIHELRFLKSVVKETLRLHPPAPLSVPREGKESCEINGYEIPAKTKVMVNVWAIGRDPKYWSEADKFYPQRFLDSSIDYRGTDFEYLPFGAGRRICPGISFALPNIELPLAQLLYHFDWKLPNEMKLEDLDMTEAFGVTVRRKNDLLLIPIPYHPPSNTE